MAAGTNEVGQSLTSNISLPSIQAKAPREGLQQQATAELKPEVEILNLGTTIKDTWTKPRGSGSRGGRR